jgi:hypothetical protein
MFFYYQRCYDENKSVSIYGAHSRYLVFFLLCSPRLTYQVSQRFDSGVNLAITPDFNSFSYSDLKFCGHNFLLITV